MNVLIDTNVILDAVTGREPYNEHAEKLLLFITEDKLKAFITASSVTDIYYLLNKYLHNKEQAQQVLIKLFSEFEIIDVTRGDCEKAFNLTMNDFEDALLATCAKRKKLDFIITRNLKDLTGSPIEAISPADFITNYF